MSNSKTDDLVWLESNGSGPGNQPTNCEEFILQKYIGTLVAKQFVHTCLSLAMRVMNAASDRLLPP